MATRSKEVFYDPVYRPQDGGRPGFQNQDRNNERRLLFDDFSVVNYVHILRPRMVSVNTSSVVQSNQNEESPKPPQDKENLQK